MDNKAKGEQAEALALKFLQKKGYVFKEKNYRYKKAEIDLIMEKGPLLIFFEIKARKNTAYGYPEEFVSKNQAYMITKAAENYLLEQKWEGPLRIDVIAITYEPDLEIRHFEDAIH